FFILALSILLQHPSLAFAKSYSIPSVTITDTLKNDGSMNVEEKRTYSFDGNYTFAYLNINTSPDQSKNPGRTEEYKLGNFALCDQDICYRPLKPSEIAEADLDR